VTTGDHGEGSGLLLRAGLFVFRVVCRVVSG